MKMLLFCSRGSKKGEMKGKGAIGVVRDDGQTRYREASVWKQGRYEERYRVVVGGGEVRAWGPT